MAQSIITVPLYSVEENDGLNRSLQQKTFKEAVARMYRENGMYIVYNRQMNYDRFGRSPNMLDVPVIYAFGRLYDTESGHKVFGAKHPYLLNWFDEIEQLGFDHFVYNHRIKKMLAVNEEENIILDDAVCQRLASGKRRPVMVQRKNGCCPNLCLSRFAQTPTVMIIPCCQGFCPIFG